MGFAEILSGIEVGLIYGIVAIGVYLTFRVINFSDMTCDGTFVLGAAVSSVLIQSQHGPWMSLMAAFLAGGMAGLVTAILFLKGKMSDLLSGILVAFVLYSINLRIMGGVPNIALIMKPTVFFASPWIVLCGLVLGMVLILEYLFITDFGLGMISVGQNPQVSRLHGVSIPMMTALGLFISNGLIALSGAVLTQYQGFVDISQGTGTLVIGLAAVMLAEKLFLAEKSVLWMIIACVLGSIVYRLFVGLALHTEWLGLKTQDLNLMTGILIIAVMVLPKLCRRKHVVAR